MKKLSRLNFARILRRNIAVFTSIAVVAVMAAAPIKVLAYGADSNYAGGAGYNYDPYLISNAQQLAHCRDQVNSGAAKDYYFLVTADIDLSGQDWTPIGSSTYPFSGTFDGGGHTISNLTIGSAEHPSSQADYGLFGHVRGRTTISHLNVNNAAIYTGSGGYAGVIAGEIYQSYAGSILYDCHASGKIIAGEMNIGGLVGFINDANNSIVNACSSSVSVKGNFFSTGGLVGVNRGIIKNSWASGTVSSNTQGIGNYWVGGLAGTNCGTIENSYFTGVINSPYSDQQDVGGIAGDNSVSMSAGSIVNCYSTFVSQNSMRFGGIVGTQTSSASNKNNSWCSDDNASTPAVFNDAGTTTGGTAMVAADMQAAQFITRLNTNASGQSGWHSWKAPASGENGGFPVLTLPGSSAQLSSLKINGTEVSNTYAYNTEVAKRTYSFRVPNNATAMMVTPVAQDSNASIQVEYTDLSNGSRLVPYTDSGPHTLDIRVTSPDGMRNCEYLVNVTRLPSTDATLSSLKVDGMRSDGCIVGGTLSPSFSAGTYTYAEEVPYNATYVTVNAASNSGKATISINGGTTSNQYGYGNVNLGAEGTTTTVAVTVTAEDKSKKTYTVNVKRQTHSTKQLSSLTVSSGSLSPAFSPTNSFYQLTMPVTATSVSLTPVDTNAGDTISVDGQSVNTNENVIVGLTPGTSKYIDISIQPHDGSSTGMQIYTVYVTWEKPSWQDSGFVATGFGGGNGTQQSPYLIETPGELAYLAQQVNSGNDYAGTCFKLTADLNLSGRDCVPIGNSTPFSGIFEGNGHTISGVAIGTETDPDGSIFTGLFGYIGTDGVIRNLSVNALIYAAADAGIVACANYGTIEGCSSSGRVNNSKYSGCIGGVIGYNRGEVDNCYFTGDVLTGRYGYAGGIAGLNRSTIVNCYARCTVSGGDSSSNGGISGYSDSDITNCYAVCNITAGDLSSGGRVGGGAGGVVGCADGGNYTHDYWSLDATQTVNGTLRTSTEALGIGLSTDTVTGTVTGKSAAEMQTSAFAQLLTNNRTDTNVQKAWICVSSLNNGYPLMNGVGFNLTSDSALSSLSVSSGALSPSFNAATTSYSVSVANSIASITVTPAAHDSNAIVTVNGATVTSGQNSQAISLTAGQTKSISVEVTSTDGSKKTVYTINVARAADTSSSSSSSGSSSSSSGSGVQINGTSTDGNSSGYSASVSAQQVTNGSVTVTLGGLTVKDTGSVLSGLIASTPGSSLRLTESPSTAISEITAIAGSNSVVSAFDIDLFSVSSSGVSTQLHQLGGNITITLTLTDAQKAQITDPSTAKLYYYDPDTKSLVDMHATFNITAGTVTFTTNHLSTFVLEQGKDTNPRTGSGNLPIIPLAIFSACSASGLIIIKKRRVTWKVKSNTVNK